MTSLHFLFFYCQTAFSVDEIPGNCQKLRKVSLDSIFVPSEVLQGFAGTFGESVEELRINWPSETPMEIIGDLGSALNRMRGLRKFSIERADGISYEPTAILEALRNLEGLREIRIFTNDGENTGIFDLVKTNLQVRLPYCTV